MTTEKRILLASVLSVLVMLAYARFAQSPALQKSSTSTASLVNPSASQAKADSLFGADEASAQPDESIELESDQLKVVFGKGSPSVKSVVLKQYPNMETGRPLQFGNGYQVLALKMPYDQAGFSYAGSDARSIRWHSKDASGGMRVLLIELDEKDPVLHLSLQSPSGSSDSVFQAQQAWNASEGPHASRSTIEAVLKNEKKGAFQGRSAHFRAGTVKSLAQETSIVTLSEQFFCQSLKLPDGVTAKVQLNRSPVAAITASSEFELKVPQGSTQTLKLYVGPRDFFKMRDAGFQDAFPIGFLGQIGLFLMLVLKLIASVTHNYGVAVIGLSIIVTIGLSPFTLMSFKSMKKMQDLQPKIEQLRKKYEKDPKRVNQEIFALFKENKVSPLSGCLPIILQMPVFFALWSAISHVIELRGQHFLWIKDLTLPDRLAALPGGINFNLLPILMAMAMYFQTKMSQGRAAPQGQASNPMAGPMMPVLFGLMFYNVSSCLVLYWLTNSLVSMAMYKAAKI